MNVDVPYPDELSLAAPIFSPFTERHLRHFHFADSILRNINKGDEILCNYLDFAGSLDYIEEGVME